MSDRLELFQILFQKRNARKRGPTSSDQFNDMIDEIAHDLAELSTQWNNRLVPLNNTLPAGAYSAPSAATEVQPDAFIDGLDGKTLYADARATSGTYYDGTNSRPTTVYQQFENVYTVVSNVKNDLENLITSNIPSADQIAITDTAAIYTAGNVETALEEVKIIVDSLSASSVDLSAVSEHVLPNTDDTYDLGSASLRWRDLYLGPASLKIVALASQSEAPSDRTYQWSVNSVTGELDLTETQSANKVITINPTTGVTFPQGAGALEVEDEGSSLGTEFKRFNFVGAGVTAVDAGGNEVTVTIPGSGDVSKVGTPVNNQIATWASADTIDGDSNLTWDGSIFSISGSARANEIAHSVNGASFLVKRSNAAGAVKMRFETDNVIEVFDCDGFTITSAGSSISQRELLTIDGRMALKEQSGAPSNVADWGKIWVKNDAPNTLWFTDDTGVDYQLGLGLGGDVVKVGTPVDNQIGIWTGDGTIEGDTALSWNSSVLQVDGEIAIRGSNAGVNGEGLNVKNITSEIVMPAGPTATVITLPSNCLLLNVTGYITTTITTDNTDTAIDIGLLGGTGNEYGSIGLTAGTDFDMNDASSAYPDVIAAGDDIVIVGNSGGNFTAGAIRVSVYYMEMKPVTS